MVGHSAGAALALWAAGRGKRPASSPLYEANPLPIRHVVALGGFANFRSLVDSSMATCGFEVRQIIGSPGAGRRDVYADTNPFDLSPDGSATTFINGDQDTIVPPGQSARDAARLRKRGDDAQTIILPDASHYDEVAVRSPAWALVEPAILKALDLH